MQGNQINVNPQIGAGHSYYWPKYQLKNQLVNTSGFPVQPQQQCSSTDSCSRNQIVPGGMMQLANVQQQNQIIQTNRVHYSESNQFTPTSQLQYAMSNLSVCGMDKRSDTTSIKSEIGEKAIQRNNDFQAARDAAQFWKIRDNHIKMGNNCNVGGKSNLTGKQQGVNPQPHMNHVVNSVGTTQQKPMLVSGRWLKTYEE